MSAPGDSDQEVMLSGLLSGVLASLAGVYHSPWWWLAALAAFGVGFSRLAKIRREGPAPSGPSHPALSPREASAARELLEEAIRNGRLDRRAPLALLKGLVYLANRGSSVGGQEALVVTSAIEVSARIRLSCAGCGMGFPEEYAMTLALEGQGLGGRTSGQKDIPTLQGRCPSCGGEEGLLRQGRPRGIMRKAAALYLALAAACRAQAGERPEVCGPAVTVETSYGTSGSRLESLPPAFRLKGDESLPLAPGTVEALEQAARRGGDRAKAMMSDPALSGGELFIALVVAPEGWPALVITGAFEAMNYVNPLTELVEWGRDTHDRQAKDLKHQARAYLLLREGRIRPTTFEAEGSFFGALEYVSKVMDMPGAPTSLQIRTAGVAGGLVPAFLQDRLPLNRVTEYAAGEFAATVAEQAAAMREAYAGPGSGPMPNFLRLNESSLPNVHLPVAEPAHYRATVVVPAATAVAATPAEMLSQDVQRALRAVDNVRVEQPRQDQVNLIPDYRWTGPSSGESRNYRHDIPKSITITGFGRFSLGR